MKTRQEIFQIIEREIGFSGRMISGSKTLYNNQHPDNIVVFNANIFIDGLNPPKIWYGDIDITKENTKLYLIAKEIGANIYILREHDGRFDKENNPDFKKVAYLHTDLEF